MERRMDMSGMDMGSSSSSDSSAGMTMSMVFTNSHRASLFTKAFTPESAGGFAGACIFLIVLAMSYRLLAAYRHVIEAKWHDKAINRRYITVAGETAADRERQLGLPGAEKSDEATLTVRGLDERVKVVRTPTKGGINVMPWRFSVDLPRACIYTATQGVGYLLMLAVMTFSIGYFFSVLAGLFLGELAVGRYTHIDNDDHH